MGFFFALKLQGELGVPVAFLDASWNFNVELSARFKELRLVVTDAGDGITVDHADWVNAGFLVAAEEAK